MKLTEFLSQTKQRVMASFDSSTPHGDSPEKRKYPRFSRDYKIDLLDARKRPADEAINLVDLSSIGVGIESRQPLAVGQTLGFQMRVGDGRPVQARATVRWTKPMGFRYAYGLQFEGMGFLDRQRMEKTLRPETVTLTDILTLLLQAASTLTAIYVAGDWIRNNPNALPTLGFCLPYFISVFAVAGIVWFFPRGN